MVFRRFFRKRRTFPRRRRAFRRGARRFPRMLRAIRPLGRQYYFTRSCTAPALQTSSAGTTYYAMYFQLNQLPNYTEFTNLFDEYMIRKVRVTFVNTACSTITGADQVAGRNPPTLYYVIDYDDASAPPNVDAMLQYPGVRYVNSLFRRKSFVLRPKAQAVVYSAGTATGSRTNMWIDCSTPEVPHYGMKFALTAAPNGLIYYTVFVRYQLVFRGVR